MRVVKLIGMCADIADVVVGGAVLSIVRCVVVWWPLVVVGGCRLLVAGCRFACCPPLVCCWLDAVGVCVRSFVWLLVPSCARFIGWLVMSLFRCAVACLFVCARVFVGVCSFVRLLVVCAFDSLLV